MRKPRLESPMIKVGERKFSGEPGDQRPLIYLQSYLILLLKLSLSGSDFVNSEEILVSRRGTRIKLFSVRRWLMGCNCHFLTENSCFTTVNELKIGKTTFKSIYNLF